MEKELYDVMPEITANEIQELVQAKNIIRLREIFEHYNNVDLAAVLSKCPLNDILFVFRTMKSDYTSNIFSYFDPELSKNLIELLSSGEIKSLLDNLMSDDVVDFLEELPAEMVFEVLKHASKEKRYYINQMLNLKPDTAGSIMGIEFLTLNEDDSVTTALEKIKKEGRNAQTINYIYVIDSRKKLIGSLRLKDIIISKPQVEISKIMETDIICVNIKDNQEAVAKLFKDYGLSAIPVINDDNYLVGIITIDDIIDIMEEETTEDIHKMAGIVPLEETYLQTGVISHTLRRVAWLSVLLVLAVFTGLLIEAYQGNVLLILPILSSFIPMLMNVGGVAGGQTTTIIIRSFALNEIKVKDTLKIFLKEIRVALIISSILAVVNFIWLVIQMKIGLIDINYPIALLICGSLFLVIIIASMIGITLPVLAKLLKLDPALFASPLLTNIMDVLALIIYFSLAIAFKGYLIA